MQLFIAEKPDLGRAIADALSDLPNYGRQERGDGYIKVGNVYITWCFGHLLSLKDPNDYNEAYKKWSFETLPFDIPKMELKPIKGKEKQIKIIKGLLKTATEVVNAGDPDEEGQLLVDEVISYCKYKGTVKRILINDNTKALVQKAINNLKDNKDFKGLADSAYARSVADWKYGIQLTRAYSIQANNGGMLSVGRVQTPILNLIYEREQEVNAHVKELFYNIKGNHQEIVFTYQAKKEELEDKLLKNKDLAETILKTAQNDNNFKVVSVDVNLVETPAPLPYNLLELQADAFKKYKYKPDSVKDITQSLREKHKAITYNRSDCQYLSDEHHLDAPKLIPQILSNLQQYQEHKFSAELKSKAFNSANVSAHHAIIPTLNRVNLSSLSDAEKNVYILIAQRYLIQFMAKKVDEKTKVTAVNKSGQNFITNSSINKDLGWSVLFAQEKEDTEGANEQGEVENANILKDIYKADQAFSFNEINLITGETKPKQLYTFATLLKDLTQVAKYVKDPAIKKLLIEKDADKKGESGGIGTPATRDSIIKLLIDREYVVEEKGKLKTTNKATEFLKSVPEISKTADMTALWAEKQRDIKNGQLSVEQFLSNDIDSFVLQEINRLKALPRQPRVYFDETSTNQTNTNKTQTSKASQNKKSLEAKTPSKPSISDTKSSKKVNKQVDTTYLCPKCNNGYLQKKTGQYGDFWGCNNYPNCKTIAKDNNGKPSVVK